ncbi:MAG: hypothetical protein KF734_01495 [Saprospiraceae bacterium]|nr:hypothetical protein [Saprospiraceae bacterium]
MHAKLNIDRHFLFLHGSKLTVFAERVLRDTHQNPYLPKPQTLWENLRDASIELRDVLDDPELKRKERTDAIREKEAMVLVALTRLADHVEYAAACKSDVFTTGFRAQTEHRKPVETVRRKRMSVKLAQLEAV